MRSRARPIKGWKLAGLLGFTALLACSDDTGSSAQDDGGAETEGPDSSTGPSEGSTGAPDGSGSGTTDEPESCGGDQDCDPGWFCDGQTGDCEICDTDQHCGPGCGSCLDASSDRACVEQSCGCLADSDCDDGEVCEQDRCGVPIVPPPEDCENGRDDDEDELVDCLDPDCGCPRELTISVIEGVDGFFGDPVTRADGVTGSDGPVLAVSAPMEALDLIPAPQVYFFEFGSGIPESIDDASHTLGAPDGSDTAFGQALAACDLNDDGYTDLVVGQPAAESSRLIVYWGNLEGITAPESFTIHAPPLPTNGGGNFAWTTTCGDLNGDLIDDLLVTGPTASNATAVTGIGAVYWGRAGEPLPLLPDVTISPAHDADGQLLGLSSVAHDLDGDGLVDLALGGTSLIKGQVEGGPETGGVLVYAGGTDWSAGPTYSLFPPLDDAASFGRSLAVVDTGQTQYLAIGAYDYVGTPEGAIFLVPLGDEEIEDQATWSVLRPPEGIAIVDTTGFADSIAWWPDYALDGTGALVTGMRYADADGEPGLKGAIALFRITEDGTITTEPNIIDSPVNELNFGFGNGVFAVGDIDGDGWSDLAVSHGSVGASFGSNLYILR